MTIKLISNSINLFLIPVSLWGVAEMLQHHVTEMSTDAMMDYLGQFEQLVTIK